MPETWLPSGSQFLFAVHQGDDISDPFGLDVGDVAPAPYLLWSYSIRDKRSMPVDHIESFFPINATVSPDSRWLAYTSGDEKGVIGVYVQPFPTTGATFQVSKDPRSHFPAWSPNGRELYFNPGPNRNLLSVRVATQPAFTFGTETPVPFPNAGGPSVVRNYDIMPDGRMLGVTSRVRSREIFVVLNWFRELREKVPAP